MKNKLLLIVALAFIGATTSFGQLKYGGGLSLGTKSAIGDSGTKIGLGINARALHNINENFAISPNFTFWLPSKVGESGYEIKWTVWQLNADVHYYFTHDEPIRFYALGGLNLTGWKVSYDGFSNGFFVDPSYSSTDIGLNLGVGGLMNDQFFGELKYDTEMDQIAITVGILF